ncbi:MAG: hypothetical protein QHH13_09580 [Melioribacter sp.]|uniref:hypothetical protein n=1 Tax=Rosettibacter primus TaxID=3111523 RepID=UPI00247C8BCB|nr:hypothetical protein [Melioribacter sp.]
MDYKLESEKICNAVEDLAKGKLKNKEDLLRIIELALSTDKMNKLEELAFLAKFSQGVLRIIQNRDNSIEDEYFNSLKNEYLKSIQEIKAILENLLEGASQFLKTIYEEKFLQLTMQSMNSLNDLCSDLVYLKYYFNDNK